MTKSTEPEKLITIDCAILCLQYTGGRSVLRVDQKSLPEEFRDTAYFGDFTAVINQADRTVQDLHAYPRTYIAAHMPRNPDIIPVSLEDLISLQQYALNHPPVPARHFGVQPEPCRQAACDLLRDSRRNVQSHKIPDDE
jgi:hypothetical protein